jgi:prepilin-type N-terminal cleavage/methylation domain-containing protein
MEAKMKKQRKERGFTLIELMLSMAVVLILVGGIVLAASRVARAARETTASENVTQLANQENTFFHEWQGYSPLATNLAGSELSATTQATFSADQELPSVEANALDAGYTNGGYKITYKAGGGSFADGAGNTVYSSFEFTAIPQNISDVKATCSDPSGSWYNSLGTGATPASGSGCKQDGYLSH